jgi:hypothetical protein
MFRRRDFHDTARQDIDALPNWNYSICRGLPDVADNAAVSSVSYSIYSKSNRTTVPG